jgi:uncharacterized membrane protein
MGSILCRIATREIGSRFRTPRGEREGLLIARGPSFKGLLDEAMDQIRQNADGNVAVLVRLLQILRLVAGRTADPGRLQAIRNQVSLIVRSSERSVPLEHDRATVNEEADGIAAP